VSRSFDQYHASVHEWTSILKISCNYDFPSVKDFAVRGLETCDIPIANRIKLYQKYEVDSSYVVPLFVKLSLRAEGPTDEETDVMGTKVALIIYRARERLRSPACSPLTGSPHPISESDAFEAINSILGYGAMVLPAGGPVAFLIQKPSCVLMLTPDLVTPTGSNGVTITVDKKVNPTHKSKTSHDKSAATGKSSNGPDSKSIKP